MSAVQHLLLRVNEDSTQREDGAQFKKPVVDYQLLTPGMMGGHLRGYLHSGLLLRR
jgi:hypothetical protein